MQPIISVVVPVYNRSDVIHRAISSLLAQDIDIPYEIVVADDGSDDGTADVIDRISPIVRIIRQSNQGAAAARRLGIQHSRGDYIAFLDSDDFAEPDHLSLHWNAMNRRDDVVLSFARIADEEGNPLGRENLREMLSLDDDSIIVDAMPDLIRLGCLTCSMNLLAQRRVALKASAREFDVPASNDFAFTLQASRFGSFAYIDRHTLRCERREDGISRRRAAEQFGYSLLVMDKALMGRQLDHAPAVDVFRNRLTAAWPAATVKSALAGKLLLTFRIAMLGLRKGLSSDVMRRFWWALEHALTRGTR